MDIWKEKDVELILQAILVRAAANPNSLKINRESGEVKITNIGCSPNYDAKKIYIVIRNATDIYISLNEQSGSYRPSGWWWADKRVKELTQKVIDLTYPTQVAARQALLTCLPEVVDIEAENALLIDKIPKK